MDNLELWYRHHKQGAGTVDEGQPPLTFAAKGTPLTEWTIFGADGGVGERTENLFDVANQIEYYYLNLDGTIAYSSSHATYTSDYIDVTNINILTLTGIHHTPPISANRRQYIFLNDAMRIVSVSSMTWDISNPKHFNVPNDAKYFRFSYDVTFENVMLYSGNNAIPYEPYGYKIPIVCGGETTNIYIGDSKLYDGDTISYSDTGVEIPTINGINTLTVNTAVQPTKVSISTGDTAIPDSLLKYLQWKYGVKKNAGI